MGYTKIIAIAGVARSGTSWLGEILDSSPDVAYRFQPIFSFAFKNSVDEDSSETEFRRFFDGIYSSGDEFLLQSDKRESGLYPVFNKNVAPDFLVWKEARHQYILGRMIRLFENVKVLAIVRHPCGVINSWLNNPKEFPAGFEPREEWRFGGCKNRGLPENFFGYYKWKETANMYLDLQRQYPRQAMVVRYCDLVDKLVDSVERIFRFVGLPIGDQTRQFIDVCHATHIDSPYSVFRDKAVKDRWMKELDPYIAREIELDIHGTRLEAFLE